MLLYIVHTFYLFKNLAYVSVSKKKNLFYKWIDRLDFILFTLKDHPECKKNIREQNTDVFLYVLVLNFRMGRIIIFQEFTVYIIH